ncbi:MAG: hypothetical protein JNL65_01860 [Saprospiraceae bacterium]|nr:hypothetical protein [Saprospiraceae bacterium]
MKTHIVLVTITLLIAGTIGSAQTAYRDRHPNQWHKRDRIEHGRQSGALSPRECHKLRCEGRKIRNTRQWMLRDGRLDHRERRKLHRMNHKFDRQIWREKHDHNRW